MQQQQQQRSLKRSIESDENDDDDMENEICYSLTKRRAPPSISFDENSPASSWTMTNDPIEEEDDRASSSIDYYFEDDLDDDAFILPISANDLPISPRHALQLATVYEFLRHFYSLLRLSPFFFEDFCAATVASTEANNTLFAQIHICLLRLLIKQDDDDGITYASQTDIKGIVDLTFVTLDYLTWPYVLQLFALAHPQLKSLASNIGQYPFASNIEMKINVLMGLCDLVLTTKMLRKEFDETKPKQHDDNCRQCQKRGDLLCCDRCEATYHLGCLNPPLTSVPIVEWLCPVCVLNQLHGVTDCVSPRENRPFYLRHRCIGHDREQRRYWFVCRRIFVEDETGDDVRYYSTLEQIDELISCLDERGPEKLLVFRLQKRYNDILRFTQITADLYVAESPAMTNMIQSAIDLVPQLDDDDEQKSLSMFTDGLAYSSRIEISFEPNHIDYEHLLENIKSKMIRHGCAIVVPSQIDGIMDDDDDTFVNHNGFSPKLNGQNHTPISKDLMPVKRYLLSKRSPLEDRLRRQHNIVSEPRIALGRLNEDDIDDNIWQRYEQYQRMNRFASEQPRSTTSQLYNNHAQRRFFRGGGHRNTYYSNPNRSFPIGSLSQNHSHGYYPPGSDFENEAEDEEEEEEEGMVLDNGYDDFGDDFFQQEDENFDDFDMPIRKFESNRVFRGTTRGRPRGRGRPPLGNGRGGGGRAAYTVQPPRGVNHLTTGPFSSSQRLLQPKIETQSSSTVEQPAAVKNKRKPVKIKSTSMAKINEEKPARPGRVLRSGRVSRKPQRDSETDFGSDNSDDSGAKEKESESDDDDEEFDLAQLGLGFASSSTAMKTRDGSSSSIDSVGVVGSGLSMTNFAAFAQSQLLAATLANGMMENDINEENGDESEEGSTDDDANSSDFSVEGFGSEDSDGHDDDEHAADLDDFTYSQTMLSLINSMHPNHTKIDLDLVSQSKIPSEAIIPFSNRYLHYENHFQTNPLATRKQMLLSERDRRAHLARKFSINHSPGFAWYSPLTLSSNYTLSNLFDILRLTLVHFENKLPPPFMHSRWKCYRYNWAKQLLDIETNPLSLSIFIRLLLKFEACIKPVAFFDLYTDQVGYLTFRRETEKERDEAKKEEKDALIRRKIDADSIVQRVHFTRPLKHSVHRQRGEEYRLTGGQGWTFVRATKRDHRQRRSTPKFDLNSLLTRREDMSNAVSKERNRIIRLIETKLKTDVSTEVDTDEALAQVLATAKDDVAQPDNDDLIDELPFISYKIIDYDGTRYRYPIMSEDTRRPFRLAAPAREKELSPNVVDLPPPWTFSFDSSIDNHKQAPNIFILPSYVLRRLARSSMIVTDAPGFINARLTGIGTRFGWPYPCGRPSVRTAWCYRVQTSTSLAAVAHHIKYLWYCIRWDLLTEKLANNVAESITTHVDHDGVTTTTQILAKRDSGPYDAYSEYLVRKSITSRPSEFNNNSNNISLSKSRSRAIPHPSSILANTRIIITEQWLPERQLQPNQIRHYYNRLQEKRLHRLHRQNLPSDEQIKQQKKKKKKRKHSKMNPRIIEKTTIIGDPLSAQQQQQQQQTAKPFIVRIPHLQPKSALSTESGKVVIVKAAGASTGESGSLPLTLTAGGVQPQQVSPPQQQQAKSFSIVKLSDGQIILVPTVTTGTPTTQTQQTQQLFLNENGISRIVKATSTSPPNVSTNVISTQGATIKRVTKQQLPTTGNERLPTTGTPRVNTIQITNLSSAQRLAQPLKMDTSLKGQQQQQQQQHMITISPPMPSQERRLRPIAPAPASTSSLSPRTLAQANSSTTDLLNSILAQQQQQLLLQQQQQQSHAAAVSTDSLLRFDPTASVLLGEDDPLTMISETVTVDSSGSALNQQQIKITGHKRKADVLPTQQQQQQQLLLPVVTSTPPASNTLPKTKNIRKSTPIPSVLSVDEKTTLKARLESKATSTLKDTRKKMTARSAILSPPPPVQQQTSVEEKKSIKSSSPVKQPESKNGSTNLPSSTIKKTLSPAKPVKRAAATATAVSAVKPKVDPEEGIRMKICETILRSLIGRIEREQNQESIKTRLEKHSTIVPKHEHRQIMLTRMLHERVDLLRQEFITARLNRKTVLVKEQVQSQRFKQQQLVLKQQQTPTIVKQESSPNQPQETSTTSDEEINNKTELPPAKKVKKITANEVKQKRPATPKSADQKTKNTPPKRSRPTPSNKEADDDVVIASKKPRRLKRTSGLPLIDSETRELSDNDENMIVNATANHPQRKSSKMKSTIRSKTITTIPSSSQKKTSRSATEINPKDIDCSCKRNNDMQEKFFIQCELCSRWLHGKCVGLTPRLAEKMNEFICEECAMLTQRAKERLYCVCQTPYDESKFYIGCDVCADWLHGACVNITPDDAEKFEVYVCPRCSTEKKQEFLNKPITGETRKKLLSLIDKLLAHKMAWPFQQPVDVKDVPNYYKIIKDPMDLTTLKAKVMSSKFKTICDFIRDVNKIFNNCRQFNPIDSTFSQCANVVDNYFRQLLENLMIKEENVK